MKHENFTKLFANMLKIMKKEFERMLDEFDKQYVYEMSLPLKPSSKCPEDQKEKIESIIKAEFYKYFDAISPLINMGMITYEFNCRCNENNDDLTTLSYEAIDKFYTYEYIKYNLNLSFLTQMYLFFEQNLLNYLFKARNIEKENLLEAVKLLESDGCVFKKETKNTLNMYRLVMNVYKHGFGISYNEISKKYPNILNDYNNQNTKEYAFIFDLNKISIRELYDVILEFLGCLN